MKNRLISFLLALLMLLAAIPTITAADFTDLDGHWGKSYIERAVEMDLFNGVSETKFLPDGTMTRGMFVTVLGRLEGVDTEYWGTETVSHLFEDVDPNVYYAPYVFWAYCNGIANGTSYKTFSPEAPVTREQTAKLVAFYVQKMGHGLKPAGDGVDIPDSFSDADSIAPWAAGSVDILRAMGILNGMPDKEGGISFKPQNKLTRAECAAIFCRLSDALLISSSGETPALPESVSLSETARTAKVGERFTLTATVLPATAAPVELLWHSSDHEVATVANGEVTAVGEGSAVITVCTANGRSASCKVEIPNQDLASGEETYAEKCTRIFGEVVGDPRMYYSRPTENGGYTMDYDAAHADMVKVTVAVWDFNGSGEKVTRYFTVEVHKNIAPTVEQIFKEIYNGEEKFPIHALGGYSRGGRSEHTIGCALDINPMENYYYNPNTGEQVGNYWKPGEDPYSIPLDGEVARIFAKYGFSQGVNWNSGAKDYMHFSYFGT